MQKTTPSPFIIILIKKTCSDKIRALINEAGNLSTDGAEIVNLLNKQFYSVFNEPSNNFNNSATPFLPQSNVKAYFSHSIFFKLEIEAHLKRQM